ncbi:MAG: hypothetical protein M3362_03875 [Acidobacteriota bacterium]|nr:hypothetical protein [Acidobacteriota bacterium]
MREVRLEGLYEETMAEFMAAMDWVSNLPYRIKKRRKRGKVKTQKLRI